MERNKKIVIASVIVSVMVLFIGIAFAALSSNLNISFGNVTQNALTWNVGFKGSSVTPTQEGTSNTGLSCGTAIVTPSTVTISDSTLSKPGDKCTYDLTIQNSGDIAANLSSIAATEPTGNTCTIINNSTMTCGKITYKLTTTSGSALTTGITINKKESYKVKLIVSYTGENINSTTVTQADTKFTLTYEQYANRSGNIEGIYAPKCVRATTLHTEECLEGSSEWSQQPACVNVGYNGGDTITYGSLGTSGTLSSGDAFDCDVNGDGDYDPKTERFYYVSGLDGKSDSSYAVLIYYANVLGGEVNYTSMVYYHSSRSANNLGPTVAYQELPSTEQWSNVSLYSTPRQIYTHANATSTTSGALVKFAYTDKAARLLSYKELNVACGIEVGGSSIGELDTCEYLLEHTSYSTTNSTINSSVWWLENPNTQKWYSWKIRGYERRVVSSYVNDIGGVRPAIEVLKADIDY